MNSRIIAVGALVLVVAGMLVWQVADAQYPGSGGGGPWGPGMMGPGMMGGYGYGMGPGMMGPGMMGGYGYGMGPSTMGPGMMGYGMGPGMMGRGLRGQQVNLNITVYDVKSYLERWVALAGNPHIRAGDVTEKDADTITADIVTTDKAALVQRFAIDRHTGLFQPEGD